MAAKSPNQLQKEMFSQMKNEMKSSQKQKKDEKAFYPKLIIYKGKLWSLTVLCTTMFFIFTYLLFRDILGSVPWWTTATPVLLLASFFLVLGPTEEWEYEPWQAKAQQYERHFLY